MVNTNAIQHVIKNLSYQEAVIEALIGLAFSSMYNNLTDDEREQLLECLHAGDIEAAAEVVENLDEESPNVDLEQRVQELCEELDGCSLPDASDPREASQEIQRELSHF